MNELKYLFPETRLIEEILTQWKTIKNDLLYNKMVGKTEYVSRKALIKIKIDDMLKLIDGIDNALCNCLEPVAKQIVIEHLANRRTFEYIADMLFASRSTCWQIYDDSLAIILLFLYKNSNVANIFKIFEEGFCNGLQKNVER